MPPRGLHCSLGKKLGPETWPEGSEKGEYILETASRAQEKQRNGDPGFQTEPAAVRGGQMPRRWREPEEAG